MSPKGDGVPQPLPLPNGVEIRSLPLSPVDGFLLSRIDGALSTTDLAQATGLPLEDVRESLTKLADLRLVAWPPAQAGRSGPAVHAAAALESSSPRPPERSSTPVGSTAAGFVPDPSLDLDADLQRLIHVAHERLADRDHYEVLGIPRGAEKKAVKRAYFEIASKFHPDKYFRKNVGPFKAKLEAVFGRATEAHEALTSKERRKDYDAYLAAQEATRGLEASRETALAEVSRAEEAIARSVSMAPPAAPATTSPSTAAAPLSSTPPGARSPVPPVTSPMAPMPTTTGTTRNSGLPWTTPQPPAPTISIAPPPGAAPVSSVPSPAHRGSPPPPAAPLSPVPAAPSSSALTPAPSAAEIRARRELLARRLLGGAANRASRTSIPAAPPVTPAPSVTDAVEAMKRRYEQRVAAARGAQAKKYADVGAAERAKGDIVAAANAYRVAVSFAPEDREVARAAEETARAADELLVQGYTKQAEYEEKASRWTDAARSWGRVAKARPDDPLVQERGARCLLKAGGNLHEAGQLAQRAVALAPRSASSHLVLAEVYLAANLALNAKREAEAAAQIAPDDLTVQAFLRRVSKGS